MKVLLVSPNVESLPDPVFPLGLAFIKSALEEDGNECRVLDLCFVQDYASAITSEIAMFSPDIIGLSLRNLDNVSFPNYVSYLPFFREVIKTIRMESRAPVVLGGSGFSLLPEQVLGYLDADLGVVGEGEKLFVDLVNDLDRGMDIPRSTGARVLSQPPGRATELDSLPMPDRAGFDNQAYLEQGGMGNIQSKRGCPFKCIYCTYPLIEGKEARLRSPGLVCDEIERILECGIDNIFFVDNTFNYPIHHAAAICREIIRRRLPVKWSCYAHPKFISPELVELMLQAGCTSLEFGTDSAHPAVLANLLKGFTLHELKKASAACREAGMPFCHSLLLGSPGDTMDTVQHTLDNILEMSPTAVICMIGIRIFPRTRLSTIAREEGIVTSGEEFIRPVFYLSPPVEEEILGFVEKFSKKHPTWIFPGLNINMTEEVQRKLRRFGVRGPLWEYMKMGRRYKREKPG